MAMTEATGEQSNLSQPILSQQPVSPSDGNDDGVSAVPSFGNFSLYIGDLDRSVNEGQLLDIFNQVAPVLTVKVCMDQTKLHSLGYGYVNFSSPDHAASAMEALNFTPINGKPIRIMHCHRDSILRKSGTANLFIKNLDNSIENKLLHDTFANFGTILSCKIEVDHKGQSKGYGYVQFDQEESAQNAISSLNGMLMNDKQVYVGYHLRRQERNNETPKFTNVYVKNLSETFTDEDLKKTFSCYGSVTSAVVIKDESGKSRCFGFVNYQSPDSAASAVDNLNNTVHDDKVWFVGRAQKKAEREFELKEKLEQERINRYERLQASNLYLKNLDDNIDEEKLKELFSKFGTITSCKVMVDSHGASKGYGFVSFSTPEEAKAMINEINGKMVGSKPLYVAIAQRKEERQAKLQAHFAQVRLQQDGMPPIPSGMPGFHHVPVRLPPHQLYFGQGAPGMHPSQPTGLGFPQQMFPWMRPGVPPNLMFPFHLQRPVLPGQRFHGRRGGHSPQFPQHRMGNRNGGQNLRYPANVRNVVDPAMVTQGHMRPVMPISSFDSSRVPITGNDVVRVGSMSMASLTSSLAAASPKHQRAMLGEQLYPLVDRLEHDHAGKVTGMLLELDQTEVLHLVESPDALKEKVAEAMTVLRSTSATSDIDKPRV